MTGKEDLDEGLDEDDYFGFGVDAGMGCVADIQTQAAFKTYWDKRLEEDPDIDPYNDLFCDLLEENAKAHPKYQSSSGDWLNWTVPDTDCNLPIFASGWGTATIRSTSATTQGARSAPCMCASSTLKPVTRSRRKEGNSDGMAETGADSELGERCPGLRQRETI